MLSKQQRSEYQPRQGRRQCQQTPDQKHYEDYIASLHDNFADHDTAHLCALCHLVRDPYYYTEAGVLRCNCEYLQTCDCRYPKIPCCHFLLSYDHNRKVFNTEKCDKSAYLLIDPLYHNGYFDRRDEIHQENVIFLCEYNNEQDTYSDSDSDSYWRQKHYSGPDPDYDYYTDYCRGNIDYCRGDSSCPYPIKYNE